MKRYSLIVLFFLLAVGTLPMAAQVSSTTYTSVYLQSPARADGRQQYSSYRPYGATSSASVPHRQPSLWGCRPFAGGNENEAGNCIRGIDVINGNSGSFNGATGGTYGGNMPGRPMDYDMQSTAAMAASGSHYSSNITEPGASSLSSQTGSERRKGWGTGGEDRPDPYKDPIGSMPLLFMLLLAMGYGYRLYRKSRHPAIS